MMSLRIAYRITSEILWAFDLLLRFARWVSAVFCDMSNAAPISLCLSFGDELYHFTLPHSEADIIR